MYFRNYAGPDENNKPIINIIVVNQERMENLQEKTEKKNISDAKRAHLLDNYEEAFTSYWEKNCDHLDSTNSEDS